MNKQILCPSCGHDIDLAVPDPESDYETFACCALTSDADVWGCRCHQSPAEIARALLTAELTDEEVEAAARAIYVEDANSSVDPDPWPDFDSEDNHAIGWYRETARYALRAARGLS